MHITPDKKISIYANSDFRAYSSVLNDMMDGNWHKFSMYINFNTGMIRQWYDVETETASNPTLSWSGSLGVSRPATTCIIQGNFCAHNPTGRAFHALDDIEIWDGMPDAGEPECNDSLDNDGDGQTDYPNDAGCSSSSDDDETNCGDTVCEGGETCSTCSDDCPTGAGQVCCSGILYTGDCCDNNDCISPEICVSHVCTTPSGTIVSVDSTYSGYSTSVIDDEVINPYGGTATTWASESSTEPHWVTINFSQPRDINNVIIYWAYNNQQSMFMSSQEVQVQYWDGSQYLTAATISNTGEVESSSITFSTISTTSLRFWQPANMGYSTYPTVIWLTEIDYSLETSTCSSGADNNPINGVVSITELMSYISDWKAGSVTITDLMTGIGEWKNGC